jgi:hypothetical protein
MTSEEAEEKMRDLSGWRIHRPSHSDIVKAIGLQRRGGREFGALVVRNPFA